MLNCRDVLRKVSSDEFIEASWPQRAGLRMHLMMCRHCRRYAKQLKALGKLARHALQPGPGDQKVLERLEKRIMGQIRSGKARGITTKGTKGHEGGEKS